MLGRQDQVSPVVMTIPTTNPLFVTLPLLTFQPIVKTFDESYVRERLFLM
jgi:hypothetical protein